MVEYLHIPELPLPLVADGTPIARSWYDIKRTAASAVRLAQLSGADVAPAFVRRIDVNANFPPTTSLSELVTVAENTFNAYGKACGMDVVKHTYALAPIENVQGTTGGFLPIGYGMVAEVVAEDIRAVPPQYIQRVVDGGSTVKTTHDVIIGDWRIEHVGMRPEDRSLVLVDIDLNLLSQSTRQINNL